MKHVLLYLIALPLLMVAVVGSAVGCTVPPTPVPPTVPPVPTSPPTVPPTALPPTRTATLVPTASPPTITTVPATSTPVPATPAPTKEITASLTWLGHPTFILTTSTGMTALLDPMGAGTGYGLAPVNAVDVVTISHEHSDHNNAGLASGTPLVLHGLNGNDWAKIDQTVKGVHIRTVASFHDDKQGAQRGKNAIFIFEIEGLRIAHLGDLGHQLDDEQIKQIGVVDVVMIPVGGFYTIDGQGAAQVVGQLKPKVVIPIHYQTPDVAKSLANVLAPADGFVQALGTTVQVVPTGQTISLSASQLPSQRTLMLMKYK